MDIVQEKGGDYVWGGWYRDRLLMQRVWECWGWPTIGGGGGFHSTRRNHWSYSDCYLWEGVGSMIVSGASVWYKIHTYTIFTRWINRIESWRLLVRFFCSLTVHRLNATTLRDCRWLRKWRMHGNNTARWVSWLILVSSLS